MARPETFTHKLFSDLALGHIDDAGFLVDKCAYSGTLTEERDGKHGHPRMTPRNRVIRNTHLTI